MTPEPVTLRPPPRRPPDALLFEPRRRISNEFERDGDEAAGATRTATADKYAGSKLPVPKCAVKNYKQKQQKSTFIFSN